MQYTAFVQWLDCAPDMLHTLLSPPREKKSHADTLRTSSRGSSKRASLIF